MAKGICQASETFLGLRGLIQLNTAGKRGPRYAFAFNERAMNCMRSITSMVKSMVKTVVWIGTLALIMPSALRADHWSPQQTAAQVDQLLVEDLGLQAAPDKSKWADDETYLRRISLDIAGQLPSPVAVTTFVLDPAGDKRIQAARRLLGSQQYGENWGRYWRDVVLFRRSEDRALIVSKPLEEFLTAEINRGAGWHDIARAMITATGDVLEDGRTGLIMAQMGQTEEIAAEVSRIFLGVQIQCAQCHDHPTDRWKRQQFHELAAFFPRIAVRPKLTATPRSFEVVSVDFAPRFARPGMQRRATLEHYMSDVNDPASRGTLVQPKFFVNGQSPAAGLRDQQRRSTLADWMSDPANPWFAKAYVNRIWAELVGEGFYEPIDDLGLERTCSAPRTMTFLAEQFAAHRYDMRWLLETIVATGAYQRGSQPHPHAVETPFAANCSQRLRGDQLYDALLTALELPELSRLPLGRPAGNPMYRGLGSPRMLFGQTFGYDPSAPRDEVAGSIPQALFLMNSPLVRAAISANRREAGLGKLLTEYDNDRVVVSELYLRCLARQPRASEMETCLKYVESLGNRKEAFEDLLWALVNSTEFLYRN
jgi:hypothetical protein